MPPNRKIRRLRARELSPEKAASDALLRTPQWANLKRMLLPYGHMHRCWLCECPDAPATELDHVIPRTERPDLVYSVHNLRPVHKHCPVCDQWCNAVRGMGTPERARRIIAERKARRGLDVRDPADETEFIEGRDL